MQKKNRPLQAANQVICDSDNTAIHELKPAPKQHRARVYMLRTGINGFTENEILYYCRLSSGWNYASELERQCAIRLERLDEPNPEPRNSMSTSQLEHLSYLEQTNITLIELGWHYHQRKDELTRLSQRHFTKQLGAIDE